MSFFPGLFFRLIFCCILNLLIAPDPSDAFSKGIGGVFTDTKLFLESVTGTFLYSFFRLLLKSLIFEHFVDSFIRCFSHFIVVGLLYWLLRRNLLLFEWIIGEDRLACRCLAWWNFRRRLFFLFFLLFFYLFLLLCISRTKKLRKNVLFLLWYNRFVFRLLNRLLFLLGIMMMVIFGRFGLRSLWLWLCIADLSFRLTFRLLFFQKLGALDFLFMLNHFLLSHSLSLFLFFHGLLHLSFPFFSFFGLFQSHAFGEPSISQNVLFGLLNNIELFFVADSLLNGVWTQLKPFFDLDFWLDAGLEDLELNFFCSLAED